MMEYNFCWEQFDNTNSISVIETDETYNLNEKIENIEELVKANKIKSIVWWYFSNFDIFKLNRNYITYKYFEYVITCEHIPE